MAKPAMDEHSCQLAGEAGRRGGSGDHLALAQRWTSDVITGLEPGTVTDLDGTGQPWRTDGSHWLIQVELR